MMACGIIACGTSIYILKARRSQQGFPYVNNVIYFCVDKIFCIKIDKLSLESNGVNVLLYYYFVGKNKSSHMNILFLVMKSVCAGGDPGFAPRPGQL